jgi:alkyldihydroxyacetonephosphate synthase
MRRWNGWGDETANYPLPVAVAEIFGSLLGPGRPPRDVSFADVVAQVPASRLPAHPLVSTVEAERLRRARGQSFPDLIALRSGHIPIFPDGVAFPLGAADVRALLDYAAAADVRLIPYGGGTSVVGHITPEPGRAPVLTVDMRRMNRLLDLDTKNRLARFGAGVSGPDLEAQLRAHGCTLGHYPQSYEYSTLGGWVSTRSRGQQSLGYGRIEQLFVGGNLEAPAGSLRLAPVPASANGTRSARDGVGLGGPVGAVDRGRCANRADPGPRRRSRRVLSRMGAGARGRSKHCAEWLPALDGSTQPAGRDRAERCPGQASAKRRLAQAAPVVARAGARGLYAAALLHR